MSGRLWRVGVLVAAAAVFVAPLPASRAATRPPARRTWASATTAAIHPGVQTLTHLPDGTSAQCTANFVFQDATGTTYLGQAAHCSDTGGDPTATDGCQAMSAPEGDTTVDMGGAAAGTMVYNSWVRMRRAGATDASTCAYNDLALIRIDPADVGKVNPSVPTWGGPTGLAGPANGGAAVYSYGNSELRLGLLSPKQGYAFGATNDGWTQTVYTATPGIPGDSGSGFLDSRGRAFGVLSTVELAPLAGSNGVGSLARELDYANTHGMNGVHVVPGTVPFSGA